jgi:hypothetical protein
MCLVCAGTAVADLAPSPDPLWNAYPLDIGGGTRNAPTPAQPASTTPAPTSSIRLDQQPQQDRRLGAALLAYAAIAGIVVCAVYTTGRQLRCRRAARRPTEVVRG